MYLRSTFQYQGTFRKILEKYIGKLMYFAKDT
jgi:hypothetical protein